MTYVFRNNTIERFLPADYQFAGYDDISIVPEEASDFVWWYQLPIRFDAAKASEEVRSYADKLQFVINRIGNRPIVVLTMADIYSVNPETGDTQLAEAIAYYNQQLADFSRRYQSVKVVDFADFAKRYPAFELIDWKFYFLSQMGLNPRLAADFKRWWTQQMDAIAMKRKKCLVLDLDNTLWHGVVGEDGVENVGLSGDYPGKAYHLWQEGLLAFKRSGVILCVCSKNNIDDAEEVWQKRSDMLLRKEDFAAMRINWQDKATNIRELAAELNIGLDSMVFVDDNPAERELVRQQLPMVAVPEWVAQPYELPILLADITRTYFSLYRTTDEDRMKTEQYQANAARAHAAAAVCNEDDFLRSLDIKLKIAPVDDISIVRAAQLTQKTNQFNLTTRRYTEQDIRSILQDGGHAWTLAVSDRFGDDGITGLIIVLKNGLIDTFLLSCRVLSKHVEKPFLRDVMAQLKAEGLTILLGQYIPTPKNKQTADLYPRMGFSLTEGAIDGTEVYAIDLNRADLSINDYYSIL